MAVTNLKINGISCPMGYSMDSVILSWQVEAESGKKPVSTTVKVWENDSFLWQKEGALPWEGTKLDISCKPRTRYRVAVTVLDDAGESHSGDTWFETGKQDEPWIGKWITPEGVDEFAPVLRKRFAAQGDIRSARLYIIGLGLYDAQLNGMEVTDEVLTPGVWDFEQEVQYQTYDVTGLLQRENELTVTLGNGWYKGRFGLENAPAFGQRYALLAELRIQYANGSESVVTTDESWLWQDSQIGNNGIYDGEILNRCYPAGEERPVSLTEIPLRIRDRISLPVKEMDILRVQQILTTPSGETVLDFGQNHAGWLRFRADLPKGTMVCFEFGEVLQQGNFYNDNYRSANGGFTYISGGEEETVCQKFTFYGFRYVRVTGWPGEIDPADFESPVLYSQLDRTGWIATGNDKLNRLYENVLWSQRSNFIGIPTDCPQRDERLGWTGDAQVFAPTACYNMDCRAFYRSYLHFLRSEQMRHDGAVPTYVPSKNDFTACGIWSDASALIPETLRKFGSTQEELAEHYALMRDWVDYVTRLNPGYLYIVGFQFGDWLAQDGITPTSFKGGTEDAYLASIYWMNSARITAQFAQLLGEEDDREKYQNLADNIRKEIKNTYFTPTGRLSVDTQAAYVAALKFGIWTDKQVLLEQFRRRLRYDNFQIRCGFVGAPLLCGVLAENGMEALACDLLLNEGFPGWLYCVNLGATTIWERWNSILSDGSISGTGMNSLNHYAYGSVMEYVYGCLGGIRPGEQGFRQAILAPSPDIRIGCMDTVYQSVSGKYRCRWEICENGELDIQLEIPFGCTAQVTLPASGEKTFVLQAGKHHYRYRPLKDYQSLYHLDTRLSGLAGDHRAEAILAQELPQLLGILKEDNREFTTQTFRELSQAFFLGLNEENIGHAVSRLSGLKYE